VLNIASLLGSVAVHTQATWSVEQQVSLMTLRSKRRSWIVCLGSGRTKNDDDDDHRTRFKCSAQATVGCVYSSYALVVPRLAEDPWTGPAHGLRSADLHQYGYRR